MEKYTVPQILLIVIGMLAAIGILALLLFVGPDQSCVGDMTGFSCE